MKGWKLALGSALAFGTLGFNLCAYATPKYKVLHAFNGTDGSGPPRGVTIDQAGDLYGASLGGGNQNCRDGCGLVYELIPGSGGSWTFAVLYDFMGGDDGASPSSGLLVDASASLYGTTNSDGAHEAGTAFELAPGPGGWKLNTLFAFCPKIGKSGCEDGGGTTAGLAQDAAGNLYGTKSGGGGYGGSVFELKSGSGGWHETMLHTFGKTKGDGVAPYAGVIFDPAANLYGTTEGGGNQCGSSSCGTVYELTPLAGGGWKETILHRFDNNGTDGVGPGGGALFMDSFGSLYGTTTGGGVNACGGFAEYLNGRLAQHAPSADIGNCGTIFKLTKGGKGIWKEAILYNFKSGSSGHLPFAGVVMDKSGNLYGTTDGGGNSSGCGVIYKLAPQPKGKWKYTVLYTFSGGSDGCIPAGNLVFDKKGNLYGGTVLGGTTGNGVIFELTP